jgi:lipoyl(octanoyl) transferase
MSSALVRLLPTAAADGAHNMAADEVMLQSAEAGIASLRFYTWSEPTLSLGYFEPEALRNGDPKLAGVPFVRRASGGATILHQHELTYALALPAGSPWQSRASWVCRFHDAIAGALEKLGVHARLAGCGQEQKLGELLCFQHQTAGDLLIGPHKVVGSAQRRRRGALMQHGSILLRQSPHTPDVPGINDLAGIDLSIDQLPAAIVAELQERTGWDFRPSDWTGAEREQVRSLTREKYASDSWNRKR